MLKKYYLFFLFLISCSNIATADDLYIFVENSKYGYFNELRKVVIHPQYLNAKNFQDGFAVVQLESDSSGKIRVALIDEIGNIVYDFYSEDNYLPEISNERVKFKQNGKYGYYDLSGNVVTYGYDRANDFSEGFAVVHNKDVNDDFYLIDIDGNPLLSNGELLSFFSIQNFYEGYSLVSQYNYETGESLSGFINTSGELVIPIEFTYLDRFYGGYCIASKNKEIQGYDEIAAYGVINRNGEWILPEQFYEIRPFNGSYFGVRYKKREFRSDPKRFWKFIDHLGNDVSYLDEELVIYGGISNGKYIYSMGDVYHYPIGYISENGNVLTDPVIEKLYSSFTEEYCPILYNGRDAILTETGDIIYNDDFFN